MHLIPRVAHFDKSISQGSYYIKVFWTHYVPNLQTPSHISWCSFLHTHDIHKNSRKKEKERQDGGKEGEEREEKRIGRSSIEVRCNAETKTSRKGMLGWCKPTSHCIYIYGLIENEWTCITLYIYVWIYSTYIWYTDIHINESLFIILKYKRLQGQSINTQLYTEHCL